MFNIPGYEIYELLFDGEHSFVYRGKQSDTGRNVVLKIMKNEYPEPEEIARFRREFEITRQLKQEGIIDVYELRQYQQHWMMVLEDFGGESLIRLRKTNKLANDLQGILRIAIRVAEIVDDIHRRNVIHKGINPSNIVLNPDTDMVKIIDFGISTVLRSVSVSQFELEGNLPYISPEQTGRMNRSIDYRSDLYSLGLTLYELLTGKMPFEANDVLEWVHAHIARTPRPPVEVDRSIPEILSDIVMKLMAKDAEQRYQSAYGLKVDLDRVLTTLTEEKSLPKFMIAQHDIPDRLNIPQKLYGREKEIDTLLSAFERVCSGTLEMLLVAGYSGIGKTSLVKEIHKPILEKRGYFISGKFDQFKRNIPYISIIEAFQNLVRQILSESDEQLAAWKSKIMNAVGANGQIIIAVIPDLEIIIGKQPAVPEISPVESQNRFNYVFQKFIRVFAQKDHPFTIFLDDLQWIDLPSLKLIELFLTDPDTRHLFIIGAYRDNEIDDTHPLMRTFKKLQKQKCSIKTITLPPLPALEINKMITDIVHCSANEVQPLSDLLMSKTGGNPFFTLHLIEDLYRQELLTFESSRRKWIWDANAIEQVGFTDNIVDFMIRQIEQLPSNTREVLKYAAALGSHFSLKMLAFTMAKTFREISSELWPTLKLEFILPASETYRYADFEEQDHAEAFAGNVEYRFAHDRIQQAAYSLIEEARRPVIHLNIGRLMLKHLSETEREEQIFTIANHLNSGIGQVSDRTERFNLAKLNFEAGRKAKASSAFDVSLTLFHSSIDFIEQNFWHTQYDFMFHLHKHWAEAEHLNGRFEKTDEIVDMILHHAKTDREKAEILALRVTQYTMNAYYEKAISTGKKALNLLNIMLPESDLQAVVQHEIKEIQKNLGTRTIVSLINSPFAEHEEKKIAIRVLNSLGSPCFISGQRDMYVIVMLKSVNLSLVYGTMTESAFSYATLGVVLGHFMENFRTASQYAELAVKLSKKVGDKMQICKTNQVVGGLIGPWVSHLPYLEEILVAGYEAGLESGEFQFAGYCFGNYIQNLFSQGKNIEQHKNDILFCLSFFHRISNQLAFHMISFHLLIDLNLSGLTENKFDFRNDRYSEHELIEMCETGNDALSLFTYYTYKSFVLYLYLEYHDSLQYAERALHYMTGATGLICQADHTFYHSLVLTALPQNAAGDSQILLNEYQQRLKTWADNCPENFLHKYLLVKAEIARINGEDLEAMDLYDQSISSAHEQGFTQNEAIANELYAKFMMKKGKEEIANLYFIKAYDCYLKWGAIRKVEELKKKYPQFFLPSKKDLTKPFFQMEELDIHSVLKGSQAISSEIDLKALLLRIMSITIENTGAQKGCLILEQNNEMVVVTEIDINNDQCRDFQPIVLETSETIPVGIINYVKRKGESLVIGNVFDDKRFMGDVYIKNTQPKSVLCTPIVKSNRIIGIIYLENNLIFNAFTNERLTVVNFLAAQAGISIENALLFEEKQKYAEELSTERSLFKTIVDMLPIMITRYDPKANMLFLNSEFEKKIGWTTKEAQNIDIMETVYPDPEYRKQALKYMQKASNEWREFQVTTKSGQIIESEWSNVRLDDETQIGIGIDITDKKRLEESLRQSQKMEAIGTLAGGIAHDFNNMLGIITGNISYVLSSLNKDEELHEILSDVQESTKQAQGLTSQLLTFSKGGSPIKKVSDINKIISDAAIFSIRGAKSKCDFQLSEDLWPSEVDESQISQVLNNLVINANQAMSNGGTITIRSENFRIETESGIPLPVGKYIKIGVEDKGVGISKNHLSKIFEPYFTTKRKGSGLGLATVYSIINRHQGLITVYSEYEKGTVFNIYLPASLNEFKESEEQIETKHKGQGKILIMDDQEPILKMVGRILNRMGYKAAFAIDGSQAVKLYKEVHTTKEKFNAVILDLTVPGGMGGLKTIIELLKIDPNVKAIVSSGYSNDPIMSNYEDYGFCGVVPKPYTKNQLAEVLNKIFGRF
ncbi:stage II sporulation protein E [Candidatus Magnetomorum sp. HK-1]|nr:stage II sporulation protein E [Candidatus Magnetomorum sp. HK-1]